MLLPSLSCLRLCLPPTGCQGAHRRISCWHDGIGDGICAKRNGLLRAPQTTVLAREQEGGGGEDNLEQPTAAARATVVAPTIIVRCDHFCAQASSFLLHHCHCYFVVGVQCNDVHLGGEEGNTTASAPASPVKIEPASAMGGGEGTRSLLRLLRGVQVIPPPPLAANRRTPRRRWRWRRRQYGGEQVGREKGGQRNCAV